MKTCLRFFLALCVGPVFSFAASVVRAEAVGDSVGKSVASPPTKIHTAPTSETIHDTAVVGSIVRPKVFFIAPKDGATVKSEFKVQFGIKGMKIAKAGALVPGAGHHHIVIDGAPYPKGQVVPADEKNVHFGKGETETTLKLSPGAHTLTLQFADGEHKSYGEALSQTIKVTVQK